MEDIVRLDRGNENPVLRNWFEEMPRFLIDLLSYWKLHATFAASPHEVAVQLQQDI